MNRLTGVIEFRGKISLKDSPLHKAKCRGSNTVCRVNEEDGLRYSFSFGIFSILFFIKRLM